MEKQALLDQITAMAKQHLLSEKEVLAALRGGSPKKSDALLKHINLAEVMYYVGGGIVFLGIVVFVRQQWEALNPIARIVSTLGSGIAAYFVAVTMSQREDLKDLAQAFFFISAVVLPLGLFVTFNEGSYDTGTAWVNTAISGILFLTFGGSFFAFRKDLFLLFELIFGTWLFFAFTSAIFQSSIFDAWDYAWYRILATGIAYLCLGYYCRQNGRSYFAGFLYGFGVFGFLGAALVLGGWSPDQSVFWELVFPGLVLAVIYASIVLKSKVFLVFGAIYLMVYIVKITSEYFAESVGWPISLVFAGLALIAIGYGSLQVNKKYLAAV